MGGRIVWVSALIGMLAGLFITFGPSVVVQASNAPTTCKGTDCGGGQCSTFGYCIDGVRWEWGANAGGTQATFSVEQPPVCDEALSASAAWVSLVNFGGYSCPLLAQVGWENEPGYSASHGFYEYWMPNCSYDYVAFNDSESGTHTYRVTYTASNGTFHFFQDGVQVGASPDLGWVPYWNLAATEVHYPEDYNAGDPSSHFEFSNVIFDGTSLSQRSASTYVNTNGYQNINYTRGNSYFYLRDSRSW